MNEQASIGEAFAELEELLRQAEWAARAMEQSHRGPERVASALVTQARARIIEIRRRLAASALEDSLPATSG